MRHVHAAASSSQPHAGSQMDSLAHKLKHEQRSCVYRHALSENHEQIKISVDLKELTAIWPG